MIIGIGSDIVKIERIAQLYERHGQRFLDRCFHAEEQRLALSRAPHGLPRTLATRFAAKEAAAKALGTGFSGGLKFLDIMVTRDKTGRPGLSLHNHALHKSGQLVPPGHELAAHLSISDEQEYALAYVVLEAVKT